MKRNQELEPEGIVDAIKDLLGSKAIDKDDFQEVVESAFISVLKKKYTQEEVFYVTFNMEKGDIEIYREWKVVDDEELEDEEVEMPLSRALELDPEIEVGGEYVEIIDYRKFGRRAITNLKQALMHKIREIEKNAVYEEYKDRIGEI
ncbi:MAG: transcription termination/antitermination protein NusA, partial [Candidatus Cloacimonetes bacterium]|nr:transcription termination/antitermination protein NusA [Candidatus Cloacimonadota bacterium]